jgi:hypothetical protein
MLLLLLLTCCRQLVRLRLGVVKITKYPELLATTQFLLLLLPLFFCFPVAPDMVATKLLRILTCCRQLVRLRLGIKAISPDNDDDEVHGHHHHHDHEVHGHQHHHDHELHGGDGPQQQQGPAAAAAGGPPGGPGVNNNVNNMAGPPDDDDHDDEFLGFDPAEADFCFGWIARLLQELEQQQQQQDSTSALRPTVIVKRQSQHPLLLWKDSDFELQQQQQQQQEQQQQQQQQQLRQPPAHLWSEDLAGSSSSSSAQQQQQQQQCVPLLLEVCVTGAAYPRDPRDWLQLQGLKSLSSLLLPHHRPPLLPNMIGDGIAGEYCLSWLFHMCTICVDICSVASGCCCCCQT